MEIVLKTALQKDSPIYALWMPVLYLGTENASGLSVLYSAVGEWLGKIWAVLSSARILKTLFQWSCSLLESHGWTVLPPVTLPEEQVVNPPYAEGSGLYCNHSFYLAEREHFISITIGLVTFQTKARQHHFFMMSICSVVGLISIFFLPSWIDPVWSWKWRIKGLESVQSITIKRKEQSWCYLWITLHSDRQ